jgi:hypothetical protein
MITIKFGHSLVFAFLAIAMSLHAQVDGLWVVTKVTVGGQIVTPVAKWIKFDDGRMTSGNGWLQHTYGHYTYDKKRSTLDMQNHNEPNEPIEPFNPFSIAIPVKDEMRWTRMEEGENVIVELRRAKTIPMSPSDELHGLWQLEKATKADVDITSQYDPQKKYWMFIQWTHNYVINTGTEKIKGFWYVNAHRPELTLLREGHEQELDKWEISFIPDQHALVLKGMSENNNQIVLIFRALLYFPK